MASKELAAEGNLNLGLKDQVSDVRKDGRLGA
jgi:hypothetical protein